MQRVSQAVCVGLLGAGLLAGEGTYAVDPPKPRPERDSLETVYDRLQKTADRAQTLEERERVLAVRLNTIRTETVVIARRMQALETRLAELDAEIADAQIKRDRLSAAVRTDDRALADLIVSLRRLQRNPPEMHALAVETPLAAARAEMVVQGALPGILAHAASLRADLAEITRLDADLTANREDQRRALAKLNGDADRLDKLRADRTAALGRTQAEKRAADATIERLTEDAVTLRELVDALEVEEAKRLAAVEAARPAAIPAPAPRPATARPETATLSGQSSGLDPVQAEPPRPAVAPGQAKGLFSRPVAGRVITRYGEVGEGRQTLKGLEINGRAEATIVAPYDGVVAFSGPFRGYGRLLIIDHGDGYHSLLAGLGRLDGAVGQAVLAGEPVGSMGQSDGSLYYELRRNGDPIDPTGWLAPRDRARNSQG